MSEQAKTLLVLSGVSGCGKSFLTQLLARERGFEVIPSITTRVSRANEATIDRQFCSREEFERLRAEGRLLCARFFFGNWYALDAQAIDKARATGRAVVQITYKSVPVLKERYPDAKWIYITPHPLGRAFDAVKARGLSQEETAERFEEMNREIEILNAEGGTGFYPFDVWVDNRFSSETTSFFLSWVDRLLP